MPYLLFLLFALLPFSSSWAQKNKVDATYKIRIAAFEKPFDDKAFDKLRAFGYLTFEPADNGFTRVYVGSYMGRVSANYILKKVQAAGFKSAYIVPDETLFVGVQSEVLTHTLQFTANRSINAQPIVDAMGNDSIARNLIQDLYIERSGGFYRYTLGLYNPMVSANDEAVYKAALARLGFTETLSRQVRVSASPKAEALPLANPSPVAPAAVPVEELPAATAAPASGEQSAAGPAPTNVPATKEQVEDAEQSPF